MDSFSPKGIARKNGEKKNMQLEDAMRDTVRSAGGRISETDYVNGILATLHADGAQTTETSVRANAFAKGRMDKAGVIRVSVGAGNTAIKEIWTQKMANDMMTGNMANISGGSAVSSVQTSQTPTSTKVWLGIPYQNQEELSEAALALVPKVAPGFISSPNDELGGMADAFLEGEHMIFEGPKGCGKTIAVAQFCFHTGLPMYRFNCSEGITEDDLVGSKEAIDGNTVWVDGIIPRWAKTGGILFADEFNGASPSVMLWMHMGMDSGTIVLPTGEKIDLHPTCRVVAAINPPEDYAGLEELNEATRDRYALGLEFDYLPASDEQNVIMDQSGNFESQLAREIVQLANDLRRMKKDRTLSRDTSTRSLVQIMKLAKRQNQEKAVERALISKFDRMERDTVRTACRARLSNFGIVQ